MKKKLNQNLTIIYYSSNREAPEFEQKIIDNLKKQAGDIPIISVSQIPMDLGKNICVGKQEACYSNSFKQLLIGLKEAKTEFCIAAEADVLYPPEYFTFTPPTKQKVYRYTNVWVYFLGRNGFWRKPFSEGAQMCGKDFWIRSIEKVLVGHIGWKLITSHLPMIFKTKDKYSWTSKSPVITFKTRKGINYKTGFFPGSKRSLPYWGTAVDIYNKMFI